MIGIFVAVFSFQVGTLAAPDSIPQLSLAEALQMSAQLDPNYVAALNLIGDAEWASRAANFAFFTPSLSVSSSAIQFSKPFFNIGTGRLSSTQVDARVEASYDLFAGLSKYNESKRARAALEQAEANELEARFRTALLTETEYYDVITLRELSLVSAERVSRAKQQLKIARARVLAGAAVQTDTLRLLLELNRARVELLRDKAALKIARVQLGRRVGLASQIDAVPVSADPAPPLPISEEDAAEEAVLNSPRALAARAAEKAAQASLAELKDEWGAAFDEKVDDFGLVVNPLLVEGQVQGGVAQGAGQALLEACIYDPESGQLTSGSFMDYAMPRADTLPNINFKTNEVLCTTNPLGIKGAGEAGTVGALAAVINSVVDALSGYGIRHVEMPATPERIWQAIASAQANA